MRKIIKLAIYYLAILLFFHSCVSGVRIRKVAEGDKTTGLEFRLPKPYLSVAIRKKYINGYETKTPVLDKKGKIIRNSSGEIIYSYTSKKVKLNEYEKVFKVFYLPGQLYEILGDLSKESFILKDGWKLVDFGEQELPKNRLSESEVLGNIDGAELSPGIYEIISDEIGNIRFKKVKEKNE